MSNTKSSSGRWIWRIVIFLTLGLAIFIGYSVWKVQSARGRLAGSFPTELTVLQYTPKDVIADLGGMKVHIPKHCAEYVEYDSDSTFGEKRKFSLQHLPASKLRGFEIDVRFPEMRCQDNDAMREDRRRNFLSRENPWIGITINSGAIYPKLGAGAIDALVMAVTDTIDKPGKFWFDNFERLPTSDFGLEAYVVAGMDPRLGKPARESLDTYDIFIHRIAEGAADTYITCNKTDRYNGIATCQMIFGMAPRASVYLKVMFARSQLPHWSKIKQSTFDLLTSFEVR